MIKFTNELSHIYSLSLIYVLSFLIMNNYYLIRSTVPEMTGKRPNWLKISILKESNM